MYSIVQKFHLLSFNKIYSNRGLQEKRLYDGLCDTLCDCKEVFQCNVNKIGKVLLGVAKGVIVKTNNISIYSIF